MQVAIYARVSTTNHGQDVDLQLSELREYCQRRNWIVTAEYIDNGVSGAKDNRPELNHLIADARQRRFDAVIVWKLDRFSRSLVHLINSLEEFRSLGISFVSLRDSIDLTTPQGVLMFQMIGAFAQFERSLIQERVKAGLRNARSKGRKLGRPRIQINADDVKALRNKGFTVSAAAADLGISERSAYNLLRQ